jgi:hypothetical protein
MTLPSTAICAMLLSLERSTGGDHLWSGRTVVSETKRYRICSRIWYEVDER